ncbi:MAG: hypothetical protein AB8F74_19540 [Saprospiraceae bacterium]
MKISNLIICIALLICTSSCFEDTDSLVPNTNPFDDDYPYDIAEFEELLELPVFQNGNCREIFSVTIVKETFDFLNEAPPVSLNNLYIDMNDALDSYPNFANGYKDFAEIESASSPIVFTTSQFAYGCDETEICVDITLTHFVPDVTLSENHIRNILKTQQICFLREL